MSKLRFSSLILIFSLIASPIMPKAIRLVDTASAQYSASSGASSSGGERKKKPQTRRSQVLSKAAFNQITSAQEAL